MPSAHVPSSETALIGYGMMRSSFVFQFMTTETNFPPRMSLKMTVSFAQGSQNAIAASWKFHVRVVENGMNLLPSSVSTTPIVHGLPSGSLSLMSVSSTRTYRLSGLHEFIAK